MLNNERVIPNKDDKVFQRHLARYQFAKNYVKDKKVVSIACGVGYGEHILATQGQAMEVIGIDYSCKAIEYANKNYKNNNLKFIIQDARNLNNFKSNEFDVVVSFETIEHLHNDHMFLQELRRLLKPGGVLLISTPNKAHSFRNLYSLRPLDKNHIREYQYNQLINLLSGYFKNINLFGQKIILKRSILSLPRYFFYRFTNKLLELEIDEFSVKPYPKDSKFASCSFLAACIKEH